MDIRLASQSDGVAAALEIKQQLGIRSIFATAHSDELTRARATVAQPARWLIKPFGDVALVTAVQAALQNLGEPEKYHRRAPSEPRALALADGAPDPIEQARALSPLCPQLMAFVVMRQSPPQCPIPD